ncbi:MAG TPA: Gldg family protein [Devosiaceae bacterium]|jgi:ABC-type uncharacterized transport system involved in gliding motility auxiliary subunit
MANANTAKGFRTAAPWIAGVLAVILFLAINIITGLRLDGTRFDLTEHRLYTLSDGTRDLIASLKEPVTITLYRSQGLIDAVPALQPQAAEVAELLRSIQQAGNGKITIRTVEVTPFSPEEDEALTYKLAGFNLATTGEKGYFGLVGTNTVDSSETIPFLDPSREAFLQYDLTRFLSRLADPDEIKVSVMDGLSMFGQTTTGRPPWAILDNLAQDYAVAPVPTDAPAIPADTDVLIVTHPATVSETGQRAIDQYVLSGKPALVFLDPDAEHSPPNMQNPNIPQNPSSSLDTLMHAWGVNMDPTKVVGDNDMAIQTVGVAGQQRVVANYLPWLRVDGAAFNPEEPVTAKLNIMRMSSAGSITPVAGATTTMTPLLQSTTNSMLFDTDVVVQRPNPNYLLGLFHASGQRQVLAAHVTGPVQTAFPTPPAPPAASADGTPAPAATQPLLKNGTINVIVVADTDMLADDHTVGKDGRPSSNNSDFVLNAVEELAGGNALVSLRGGGLASRPFTRIMALQADAESTYRATEQKLTQELADVQQKLLDLQQPTQFTRDQDAATVAQQQTAQAEFNTRMVDLRRQLYDVRLALRSDIETLEFKLRLFNIALMPALVILGALLLALWRRMRMRRGFRASKQAEVRS